MSTLKDTLCLLAILVAYGIAGRMDHDDAVMLEEVRRAAALADCTADEMRTTHGPQEQDNDLRCDPRDDGADANTPNGDVPCTSPAL
ncbi:hypothetical protein [Methylibium sp.]|uniref:hypothetical protein n=1 Tax=Methylibium sp. TaxID=2067992 RepID=UPI003D0EA196